MTRYLRAGAVVALLCATVLLAGCPPGAAGGQSQANMPPGIQPPPGLESGGARTLMGTTITAPNDSFLLVRYSIPPAFADHAKLVTPPEPPWQSCRRVIPTDAWVLVEGLNYDGRDQAAEKDVNQLLPASGLAYFYWKYELKPAPPAEAMKKETPGKKGR